MFLFIYEELITKHERNPTMGYAIFTARKLMLTNRVNQLSMRIMQLTQQQQTLANSAANHERAIANMRSLFSNIGNIFQMGMTMQQNVAMQALSKQVQAGGGNIDTATLNQLMGSYLNGGANFMSTPAGMALTLMNQAIEVQEQGKMRQIKDMETQIELQRKSLETQLAAAQKELEAVEKQEEKEIERSAPKFA